MEKANRKSFRLGIVVTFIVLAMFAVFTLTACQDGVTVESLEIQEDTNPGVMIVGGTVNDLGIKLSVTTAGSDTVSEVVVTSAMLTSEGREALKTVGEKTVTVQYKGVQTTFEILVVDEETETATVVFYDKDNNRIAQKTVVKGDSVNTPNPPEVEGETFVEWVVRTTSASATSLLRALDEDLEVKAKYAANATTYTVTVIGPDGENRGSVQVLHGNKISLDGINTRLSSEYDASTLTWTPDINTYIVTNNVTVHMDAQKKEKTVEYCYAFASKPEVTYSLGLTENVVIGKNVTKQNAARTLITQKGLTFVEWQNTSTQINADTKFVAIVADRTFTVRYKNGEHPSTQVLAGTQYTLPTTAPAKNGYDFVLAWSDAAGTVYRLSTTKSIVINADVVLEAVYSAKAAPVKLIFNFDLYDRDSGLKVTEEKVYNDTKFGDKIGFEYVSAVLEQLKKSNADYAGFEIEKIEYDGVDVTTTGVTLGETVGSAMHEFVVTVVNATLGTTDLTIVNGVVKAYAGSSTGIFIPAEKDGVAVTEIEANAFAGKTIVRIVIPDSVKKIGEGAFAGATFGSDVDLPALTTVGKDLFKGAKTTLVSADGEEEEYVAVTVTFASGEGTFSALPESAFEGSENIVAVRLPASATAIGKRAFFASDVATVDGLENVETVGVSAFEGSAVSELNLPKVKELTAEGGETAHFAGMANLTALTLATDSEGSIAFTFESIKADAALRQLTLGKGIANVVAIDGAGLSALGTISFVDELTAFEGIAFLPELTALTAVNVTASSADPAYASHEGVLYTVSDGKAALSVYPTAKGGDYVLPAKVNGKDVVKIDADFSGCLVNSLTLTDAVVTSVIGTDPVAGARTIRVNNVAFNGAPLGEGETLVTNVNKIRNAFFYAKNFFVNGGAISGTVIEENGWQDVFMAGETAMSEYDAQYGLAYELVEKKGATVAVVLFGNPASTEIVVPAKLGGKDVTEIADGAFAGYTHLEKLTVLATLSSFGEALENATALTEITVAGWTDDATVDKDAFDDTAWAKGRNLLVLGGKMIKYNDFAADIESGVSTDLVPEDFVGVKEIPDGFFKNAEHLTSVVLPASVTTIGKEAFASSSIEEIDFASVLVVKDKAFENAAALKKVVLSSVGDLGTYVFAGCSDLEEVIVTSVVNRGYLPVGTFKDCTKLTSVTFGEGALEGLAQNTDGESYAFAGCTALETVDFLTGVTMIPAYAFAGCTALRSVDFTKNAVTVIGERAFADCTGLEAVIISSRVTDLGENAFAGCSGLIAVRFVANGGILAPTHGEIDYDVFPTTGDYKIYVASSAVTDNIARYEDHIVRVLPRVSFEMYPGYAADGALGMIDEETIYMDTAPEAPAFEGYAFDAWYLNDGGYRKVTFPFGVERNVTLYARYFNIEKGSIVESDLVFDEATGTYSLVNYGSYADDAAYIPETFGGKPITVVYMGAFAACENLTELSLPAGVEVLKKGTPTDPNAKPNYLKKLSIPAGVKTIEEGAISDVADLDLTFAEGSELVNATKESFVGTKWYVEKSAVAREGGNNGFVTAGRLAVEYLGESRTVECPTDLYKLADGLFKNNLTIEEIVINNDLTYVGEECFVNATNLRYVTYSDPAAANEIDGGNGNSSLVYVTADAFAGTAWLSGKNKAIVGTIFLKYNGLEGEETVSVPDYVTVINADAFRGDGTVKEVRFGSASKLVKVGDYAFAESKLALVVLPSVKEMGDYVFADCVALRTADLSATEIEVLPQGTFYNDASLNTLVLPDSVEAILVHSLTGCAALKTLVADSVVDTEYLSDSGLFDTAFYNVAETDEAQYVVLGKVLVKYVSATVVEGEEIVAVVPDGVEVIFAGVFQGTSVTAINVPASVRVIEQNAFFNATSLAEVNFVQTEDAPSALVEIGDMAFYNATALTAIALPESLQKIGNQAFSQTSLTEIEIPDATAYIGYRAFYSAKLLSVRIGAGLRDLGNEAFAGCADLHKVEAFFSVEALDEIIENAEARIEAEVAAAITAGERVEPYDEEVDFVAYVEGLFAKAIPSKVRLYVDRALYNYVVNTVDDVKISSWDNDNAEMFAEGDYPQVSFDNNGYYMQGMQTERIETLGVPAKTGNTFMGWYLDAQYENEIELPYAVYQNTIIYAKWFVNAVTDVDNYEELSFSTRDEGYAVTGVSGSVGEVLYVPSTVLGLPVVGIALTEDVPGVKKIVLTNASAIGVPESNIFRRFVDLEEVALFSDDGEEEELVVTDGVLYTVDGKILIAYLATTDEEGNAAEEFVVPDGVESILSYAFATSGLRKITISASVVSIGEHAFNDELKEIEFAEGIALTDADSRSFDNTLWYNGYDGVYAARTDYVVNGSVFGFFYSAGNMLLRYKYEASTNELRIPDALKGFDVTVIAGYIYTESRDNDSVSELLFSNLVLPGYLRKINEKAFNKINVRVSITTASTVLDDIADDVFSETTYYINNNRDMIVLGNVLLKWTSTTTNVTVPEGIVSISSNAFSGSQVQKLTLPSTLKHIGDSAFYNCAALTEVVLPDSVVSIGESAFAICLNLTTVTFNVGTSNLTSIGESAFENCKELTNVALPYRLENLGDKAFNNCTKLTAVTFDYVTQETNADNVIVTTLREKSKLTYLGESAFANCRRLSSISLPNNITAIKTGAFLNCDALKTVTFDVDLSKVTVIESEAFAGCASLGSEIDVNNPSLVTLVLPNSLIRISESAFKDCTGLFGVRVNYNVRYIEENAFFGCKNLAKVDVYSNTPAEVATTAFNRGNDAVYKLRIYVANSKSGDTKAKYKREWATYADCIYERSETPVLYYTTSEGGAIVTSDAVERDVIVSPSWTYKGTSYTTWTFSEFATIAEDGTVTADSSALRLNMNVATGTYAVVQGSYVIVVVDYDVVRLRTTI